MSLIFQMRRDVVGQNRFRGSHTSDCRRKSRQHQRAELHSYALRSRRNCVHIFYAWCDRKDCTALLVRVVPSNTQDCLLFRIEDMRNRTLHKQSLPMRSATTTVILTPKLRRRATRPDAKYQGLPSAQAPSVSMGNRLQRQLRMLAVAYTDKQLYGTHALA